MSPLAITPKHLILNLLMEAESPISSQSFIRICGLFEISENSARVTLARLSADGMLASPKRGLYSLGEHASTLAEDLAQWRGLEKKVVPWAGDWAAVFIGALGRADRTALRRRDRILQLAGYRELESGLMLRPNNMVGGVAQQRSRLYRLGLEQEALVVNIAELSDHAYGRAISLWNSAELQRQYQQGCEEMEQWIASAGNLEPQVAAKESFLLGDKILRLIAYDPMLPADMIDRAARRNYIDTMIRYDQIGKEIWAGLYQSFALEE